MGLTRTFYIVRKGKLTVKDFNKMKKVFSEVCGDSCTIYYGETLDWIPLFATSICEGTYYIDDSKLAVMEEISGSPVMACSVFDSDVALIHFCRTGEISHHIYADEAALEEFGFEEYSTEPPGFLCDYGVDRKKLIEIWKEENIFAEECLYQIAKLMKTILVFDHDEKYEGIMVVR